MKNILYLFVAILLTQFAYADDTVFDSMDKPVEIKLAPAIHTSSDTQNTTNVNAINATAQYATTSLKEEKFNSALSNLDDAQVELRQELAEITAKYNSAVEEKEKAIAYCKSLKREMNDINKKMKNVEKSKKMIAKNLEVKE